MDTSTGAANIVVVIAAYNAAETITRAVQSALAEPQVFEIVVVDDKSSDNTIEVAIRAGQGDPRLKTIKQNTNQGPSAARNRALTESSAPYIAILDADDIILPGRFQKLLDVDDWDLIADNIVFVSNFDELTANDEKSPTDKKHDTTNTLAHDLSLDSFVKGNIPTKTRQRGELGFLKPLISREFLNRHNLRYEEDCRLGEDFLLYAQLLAFGARFKVSRNVGYAALVRHDSLSGRHGVAELRSLYNQSLRLKKLVGLSVAQAMIIEEYLGSLRRRLHHREVLALRREIGLIAGIKSAAARPTAIVDILRDWTSSQDVSFKTPRLLFENSPLDKN